MMFISRVSQTGQQGLLYSDLETGLLRGFGGEVSQDVGLSKYQMSNCSPWKIDSYGGLGDVHNTSKCLGV